MHIYDKRIKSILFFLIFFVLVIFYLYNCTPWTHGLYIIATLSRLLVLFIIILILILTFRKNRDKRLCILSIKMFFNTLLILAVPGAGIDYNLKYGVFILAFYYETHLLTGVLEKHRLDSIITQLLAVYSCLFLLMILTLFLP